MWIRPRPRTATATALALALVMPGLIVVAGCGEPAPTTPVVRTDTATGPESVVDTSKVKAKNKAAAKLDIQ